MKKKYFTFLLLTASMTGQGQIDTLRLGYTRTLPDSLTHDFQTGRVVPNHSGIKVKIDTLRATLMITTGKGKPRCIPFTVPGYVVTDGLFEQLYLDDRKRVIKAPVEVWGYKLK